MRLIWQRCLLVLVLIGGALLPPAHGQPKTLRLSEDEQSLLELINAERRKEDLAPLKPSLLLFQVARAHAVNMAKQRKLEHKLDGKTPYDRIRAAGYKYTVAGENVARGDVSLAEIVQEWMKSKIHRENILASDFSEIGIGMARDGMGEMYYAQVFAMPQK
jgi:uncharacterized protein YkwD